jgi:hypothetical protein
MYTHIRTHSYMLKHMHVHIHMHLHMCIDICAHTREPLYSSKPCKLNRAQTTYTRSSYMQYTKVWVHASLSEEAIRTLLAARARVRSV